MDSIITPPLNQDFRLWISKVFRIKRSILDKRKGASERILNFLCNLFANQNAYEKNKSAF